METLFVVLVGILFLLAISDLVVGVSNDAVNFLVSAIGSKAASFRLIMIVASVGIVLGATFSSGMMEVARKGIFHPQHFVFIEIMVIFLAVMITDIILLDLFNTFGLPTSTTVSIVFELLGAAVAISVLKIASANDSLNMLTTYINIATAVKIIGGIFLSVFVAFTVGAIVQYISRAVFTFRKEQKRPFLEAVFGGIAITAITFFLILKGAKGASFMTEDTVAWIYSNMWLIIAVSLLAWSAILYIAKLAFKLNILKIIVLVGTFSLAMAFAGNDLVNFIGVPLAGLKSYEAFSASGIAPDQYSMEVLAEKVAPRTFLLIIAGGIMVITLWVSKKARSVTETSINLSRQDEGYERFSSSLLSRWLVRGFMATAQFIQKIVPPTMQKYLDNRFVKPPLTQEERKSAPAFDLIRASINLVTASILIAIATSRKLPLSTTYVTFMVAMGTSLADGAWGRESATYRVNGVLSVIGGWFVTAIVAFLVSFIFALFIMWLFPYGVFILLGLAIFMLLRSRLVHQRRELKKEKAQAADLEDAAMTEEDVVEVCQKHIGSTLINLPTIFNLVLNGLEKESRKTLHQADNLLKELEDDTQQLKYGLNQAMRRIKAQSRSTDYYYLNVVEDLRSMTHNIDNIIRPSVEHIDNSHKGLLPEQIKELHGIVVPLTNWLKAIKQQVEGSNLTDIELLLLKQEIIVRMIAHSRKEQITRSKTKESNVRNSLLFFKILQEIENLIVTLIRLLKAQKEFVDSHDLPGKNDEHKS